MWCIRIAVSTWPLLGKNCVVFYRSGLTSIWPIAYRYLSMPLLVVYWCHSRLMRRCFRGRSTSFKGPPFSVEMSPLWLKHMYSVLSALTRRPLSPAARFRISKRGSAWAGVFAISAMSPAESAYIIVCAMYLLLLSYASLKPLSFFFIKFIHILST